MSNQRLPQIQPQREQQQQSPAGGGGDDDDDPVSPGASNNERLAAACRHDQVDLLLEVLEDARKGGRGGDGGDAAVDANSRDGAGNTPLHTAARFGSLGCAEILLQQPGIDVNVQNTLEKDTPLHLAAAYKGDRQTLLKLLDMLVEAGADPRILNKNRQKPAALLDATRNADALQLLRKTELAYQVQKSDLPQDDDDDDDDEEDASD